MGRARELLARSSLAMACAALLLCSLPSQTSSRSIVRAGGPDGPRPGQGAGQRVAADGHNLFEVLAAEWDTTPRIASRTFHLVVERAIYRFHENLIVGGRAGTGPSAFSLTLDKLDRLNGTAIPDLALRRRDFELSAGYLHQFRDFRVKHPREARRNYRAQPAGTIERLGRKLLVFDLLPRRQHLCSYRIMVDAEYPVVLDQIKFSPDGRVTSYLTYNSVVLGPAAARLMLTRTIAWWKPWMKSEEHRTVVDAAPKIRFTPTAPTNGGDGFVRYLVRTTLHPGLGRRFLVLGYTDGIDVRFVLQAADKAPPDMIDGRPWVPVRYFHFGPVTQYHARHRGVEYIFLGTFHDESVPRFLEQFLR